jgi:hypothetical protein
MAKFKSTRDSLVLSDLSIDTDKDGVRGPVILNKDGYLNVDILDEDEFRKSYDSGALYRSIKRGWIIEEPDLAIGSEEIKADMVTYIQDTVNQFLSMENAFQFLPQNGAGVDNAIAGSANTDITVEIGICNGHGTMIIFDNTTTIVVSITGGSAGTKQIRIMDGTYGAGPITLTAVKGKLRFQIKGTAGTITLGLSGGNSTLDKSDTITVTLS